MTIWTVRFLKFQGVTVTYNIYYQDNESAIKLQSNGRSSAGDKSRHIDIRYFFIKDRISKNEIKVEYCPTEKMLADFFTKPLQGTIFRRFRDVIMGHAHIDTLINMDIEKMTSKERVDKSDREEATPKPTETVKWQEPAMGQHDAESPNGKTHGNSKSPTYAEIVRGKNVNETEHSNDSLIQLN